MAGLAWAVAAKRRVARSGFVMVGWMRGAEVGVEAGAALSFEVMQEAGSSLRSE